MSWGEFRRCVASDLQRYGSGRSAGAFVRHYCFTPGFRYTFWMRAARYFRSRSPLKLPLYTLCRLSLRRNRFRFGIDIPYNARIGEGLYIGHFGGIVIHVGTHIGRNCNINHDVTIGATYGGRSPGVPVIGDRVYLGPGSKIIGAIQVGNDVAVGANAVVTRSVPDGAVVVGIPGEVISTKGSAEYIAHAAV